MLNYAMMLVKDAISALYLVKFASIDKHIDHQLVLFLFLFNLSAHWFSGLIIEVKLILSFSQEVERLIPCSHCHSKHHRIY